ncbi:MAG TPA: 3-deoxy-7-phosphoheptulonate synthase, partial [Ferroplasma sp.]|nr:3-deoxy-7-phosphoheptulonate synthase [Ferroplasma sp.]
MVDIKINDDLRLTDDKFLMIAGPCSVESEEQIISVAKDLRRIGVNVLRGGAFKPRTCPDSFQGLGEKGLKLLAKAREATGMAIITEVMDIEDLPLVEEYADILQIGSRNSQNF